MATKPPPTIGDRLRGMATRLLQGTSPSQFWLSSRERLGIQGVPTGPVYNYHPAVYRCVSLLARSIGRMGLKLCRGTLENHVEVTSGPWALLFANPNSEQDTVTFVEAVLTHWLTDGACFIVFEGELGLPVGPFDVPGSMYPLNPRCFDPIRDRTTRKIAAWTFNDPVTGGRKFLTKDEILIVRFMNPADPDGWLSPLAPAATDVRQDLKAGQWNEAFFDNGAEPGGILSTEGPLTTDEVKRLRKEWNDVHGGPRKAHKAAILSNGLKYQVVGHTHVEMAFTAQREMNETRIATVYGVPTWFLNRAGDLSYATAKSAERILYTGSAIPLSEALGRRMTSKLIRPRDKIAAQVGSESAGALFVTFDTTKVEALRDDLVNRLGAAKSFRDLGVPMRFVNEILELGIPDEALAGWGDVPLLPMGLAPASLILDAGLAPDPAAAPAPGGSGGAPGISDSKPLLPAAGAPSSETPEKPEEPGAVSSSAPILAKALEAGNEVVAYLVPLRALAVEVDEPTARGLLADAGVEVEGLTRGERNERGWIFGAADPREFDRSTLSAMPVAGVVRVVVGKRTEDDDGCPVHGWEVDDDARSVESASEIPGRAKRLAIWRGHVRVALDPGERRFRKVAAAHERRVYRDVIAFVESLARGMPEASVRTDLVPAVASFLETKRAEWDRQLVAATSIVYSSIAHDATALLGTEIPGGLKKFTVGDPKVLHFLAEKRIKLARDVNGTLAEKVRATTLEVVAETGTLKELATALQEKAGVETEARAKMIARTETAQAFNGVRNVGMKVEGVSMREWLTSGDTVVRMTHRALDGKRASVEGSYPIPSVPGWSGPALRYPADVDGDPGQIINCRCTEFPILDV